MNVPKELIIGDTWSWEESFADYLSDEWTLTLYFVNSSTAFNIVATPESNDAFDVDASASTTGNYTAGRYQWTARVTKGAQVITVGQGWSQLLPDPTVARDARSHARIVLDALEATIQGKATSDQLSVSINGRSITRLTPAELEDWRSRLREEVRAEEEGANAGLGRDVRVRLQRGY